MTPMANAVRAMVLRGLESMAPHQAPARPPRPAAKQPALSVRVRSNGKMHLGPVGTAGLPTTAMATLLRL